MGSTENELSLAEEALLQDDESKQYTGDGSVDFKGRPVLKRNTGNWKACPFILGNECCERLAYYGIATNLVTYLTQKLHEGNVSAARNVTTWQGTCYLAPLIGAVLADAYWGRYWTIAIFSTIYFIGMGTLTLSASVPALKPAECLGTACPPATPAQYAVFFFGLYLIALGTGGIKPCVSSFGADQFDDTDPQERIKKGSFFNWFYFSINIGALVSSTFIVWIQENAGWGLGFGIPALFMALAIGSFFLGTPLYRFQKPGGSPITRMCQVVVASVWKRNLVVPEDSNLLYETPDKSSAIEGSRKLGHSDELKCLDRAAVVSDAESKSGDYSNQWRLCTVTQVEELKILIRMFPVWATGIVFAAVYAQMSTLFVEQGTMMNTNFGSFRIPPASLSSFDVISVIFWVPVYDRIIVPIARKFTGKERGFSELQRMGIGLFISVLCMSAAAIVEIVRLKVAKEHGLVDEPVPVPLNIFWQIPQYFLLGAAEVFTFVGQLEFFYDQSPDAMRSLCSALSLLTTSLGNYLSSFILTVVTYFTTQGGNPGWIPDNLNKGHLDYFFWLLAGLSFLNTFVYIVAAKRSHEGNVSSARNISIWLGTSYLTPLIGAVLADGYWGRYWTIAVFSAVYFIGMCTLTLSASLPALKPSECLGSVCPSATPAQYSVSYFGLYVIALGIGGIKSCVPSFGAGAIVSCSIVVWIQDNAGWGLGFGIPTLFMVLSVVSFFRGTPLYWFQKTGGSPVTRMCQDFLHQIPQYFLLGAAEVFAFVGLLQFFYDQSPDAMKTLGTALSPLYFALGNYLSSFILNMVTYFSTQGGKLGWIPDNLNKGHLDYFFLLLAGLSFLNMLAYVVAAAEEDFLRFFRHLL
ncbi:Protein NRT1/ PTR FAMILY 8.3 [Glycine max]|nr:Protein NRT1/ PTR FAMILY 8.3 [Glycine max]